VKPEGGSAAGKAATICVAELLDTVSAAVPTVTFGFDPKLAPAMVSVFAV
jgi:hypothetical protein